MRKRFKMRPSPSYYQAAQFAHCAGHCLSPARFKISSRSIADFSMSLMSPSVSAPSSGATGHFATTAALYLPRRRHAYARSATSVYDRRRELRRTLHEFLARWRRGG